MIGWYKYIGKNHKEIPQNSMVHLCYGMFPPSHALVEYDGECFIVFVGALRKKK